MKTEEREDLDKVKVEVTLKLVLTTDIKQRPESLKDRVAFLVRENLRETIDVAECSAEVRVLPDWWVIEFDETEHWRLDPELMKHVDKIWAVYAFNRNVVTHLCSFQGSYWLECLNFYATFKDPDLDERTIERIDSAVRAVPVRESDGYHNDGAVDAALRQHPKRTYRYGCPEPADEELRKNEPGVPDWLREAWASNPQF